MVDIFYELVSNYLIEFMVVSMFLALFVRYKAYRESKNDQTFYGTFTHEVEKEVQFSDAEKINEMGAEKFLLHMMENVSSQLPKRNIREKRLNDDDKHKDYSGKAVSLQQYVSGNEGLINAVKAEVNAFSSKHPPNFHDLTTRIMDRDMHWKTLFRVLPFENVSRLLDIMPGVFIVIGIFGTFFGISQALPHIAAIDFDNIGGSSEVLSAFVLEVTFAMKTSIAGIACSLILSILNAIWPIMGLRMEVFGTVEQCLENLWMSIQRDPENEHQLEIQEQIVAELKELNQKFEHIRKAA